MGIYANMLFLLLLTIVEVSSRFTCPDNKSPYLPIKFPTNWIHGSINCLNKGALQPDIDIFSVNNQTFILRENKCINYEAPFMFLLFGYKTVLLIDSGATVSSLSFPIQQHVESIISYWCIENNKQRKDIELIVAHTHNHADHTAGDEQFKSQSFTTVIGTTVDDVSRFFQIDNWPKSIGTYALDNKRHLAIIPIPGHEKSSIAFYDCATGFLLTGDSLYPGRLYISDFSANVKSISRLLRFIKSNHLNITAILGNHIEMTANNKIDYPIGTTYQPNERELNMSLKQLEELNKELKYQWKTQRYRAFYDTFIVDPNPSQLPLLPSNERIGNHRFILMPIGRFDYVWISYKPMFYTALDFQLVFLATIDRLLISENATNQWLIESYELSLNNLINGNVSLFPAKLYTNINETYLYDITINVIQPFLTIAKVNLSEIEPYQPLRYMSYFVSNSTASQIDLYLLHQMRVQPDFDAIVQASINPQNCISNIEKDKLNNLLEQNGNEWAFHGIENNVLNRLTFGEVRAQLLGDIYSTICTIKIIKEIQCSYYHLNESYNKTFHYQTSICQQIKMINSNDNKFFHGFTPIWALILFGIAALFVIIFIAGLICHFAGCRRSRNDGTNNTDSLLVEQALLEENNRFQLTTIKSEKTNDSSF